MRLEQLTLDDLTVEQRELYDAIVGTRTGSALPARVVNEDGELQGPFNAMLHYPRLGIRCRSSAECSGSAVCCRHVRVSWSS